MLVNSWHEKRKQIMEQKLKIWEKISKYYEEIYEDCLEIEDEYFKTKVDKNKIISLFIGKNNKNLKNIRKIDTQLKNYYILFEKNDYLLKVKKELYAIESFIEMNNEDCDIYELHDMFVNFQLELSNSHKILNAELVKVLENKKMKAFN